MQTESVSTNTHNNSAYQNNYPTNQPPHHRILTLTTGLTSILIITSLLTLAAAPPITPPTQSPPTQSSPTQSTPTQTPPDNTINNSPEFRVASASLRGESPNQSHFSQNVQNNSHTGSRLVGWTDSRCNNCHIPSNLFSHPTGVTPTRPLPSSFPLVNGKIECITCHASDNAADHARARNNKTQLLRGNRTGDAFCAQCHNSAGNQRRDMHAFAAASAHFGWDDATNIPGFNTTRSSFTGRLNSERENCLSCHDGLIASEAAHTEYGSTGKISGSLGNSHPINMPYRISNPGDSDVTLKPEQLLDKRIRLFNGTVQCASCHSLFSKRKNLLVMSNRGSNLCLNCHQF